MNKTKTQVEKSANSYQKSRGFCLLQTLFFRNVLGNWKLLSMIVLGWLTALVSRVAESEVFGWSRSPKNARVRNHRIVYPTPEVQLNNFLHRTPKLGILNSCSQTSFTLC